MTKWSIRSFSEFKNLRKASTSPGSFPVRWASETKIQSPSDGANLKASPSHAAIIEPKSFHLIGLVDISQINEDWASQQALDALEI